MEDVCACLVYLRKSMQCKNLKVIWSYYKELHSGHYSKNISTTMDLSTWHTTPQHLISLLLFYSPCIIFQFAFVVGAWKTFWKDLPYPKKKLTSLKYLYYTTYMLPIFTAKSQAKASLVLMKSIENKNSLHILYNSYFFVMCKHITQIVHLYADKHVYSPIGSVL